VRRVRQDDEDQVDTPVSFTLANAPDNGLNIANAGLDLYADA